MLRVYYDSQCFVCAQMMNRYKKLDVEKKIQFIDIHDSSFSAKREGLNTQAVFKTLHVKDHNDCVVTGMDGLAVIWKELGVFPFLRALYPSIFFKPLFRLAYFIFSRNRGKLPFGAGRKSP